MYISNLISQIRSQNEIIVMELCSGGSLFTLLESPANAYGFQEDDFKQVVKDVGRYSMTHLTLVWPPVCQSTI